jgi:hypothetical protein
MAYPLALIFLVMVCGFSLLTALRIGRSAKLRLGVLQHRVEQHAHQQVALPPPLVQAPVEAELRIPLGESQETITGDVEALIDEVFHETNPEVSSAALQQLMEYGMSIKEQCLTARRGLMRIPSLSGVAVSVFVLASLGFNSAAVRFALASLGMGVVTTAMCQLVLARAKKTGQTFVEFVQMMERELLRAAQKLEVS